MPVARKRKSYGKRRYAKKTKRSKRSSGTSVGRSIGFPRMLKFKHSWTESGQLISGGGTGSMQFRCNGMFDPNFTNTGTLQPMYFDQLSAIYNHYTVIASQIDITFMVAGTVAVEPFRIAGFVNDDASYTISGNIEEIASQKGGQIRQSAGGIAPRSMRFRMRWSAKKMFGGSILGNNDLEGSNGVDPLESSYYSFYQRAFNGTASITTWYTAKITYIAIWRELKDLGLSV